VLEIGCFSPNFGIVLESGVMEQFPAKAASVKIMFKLVSCACFSTNKGINEGEETMLTWDVCPSAIPLNEDSKV